MMYTPVVELTTSKPQKHHELLASDTFKIIKIIRLQAIVAFFAALAATNAIILAPSARIIQGPSSRTTIAGPDGSVIDSVAPGGSIVTEEHPGVVAHTAPIVSAYAAHALPAHTAYAGPVLSAYSTPVVSAYSAPVVSTYSAPAVSAYSAPAVSAYSAPLWSAYAAPSVVASGLVAQNSVDTVVAGPSGTIATSKTVAAPALYSAPTVYANHGVHGLYL
ncbi:hypothetical protein JTB14_027233 [Gonioctena quinquepunctata]|nr:hypothetical protein JTB14_027233 [Gonioctena quinquepunctata]